MEILIERACNALLSSALLLLVLILLGMLLGRIKTAILNLLCTLFGAPVGEFIINRLTFPGTIHHELSHALLAAISGARVTRIHLFQLRGSTLGSVQMIPRGGAVLQSLQLCLSAIAPALCGVVTLYLLSQVLYPQTTALWQRILILYLCASIFLQMTLSRQDLNMARRGLPLTFFLLFTILFLLDINLTGILQNFFYSEFIVS